MSDKKVHAIAIPFLIVYLFALALLAGAVTAIAKLVCVPYVIVKGRPPKWADKLDEYIGIYNP